MLQQYYQLIDDMQCWGNIRYRVIASCFEALQAWSAQTGIQEVQNTFGITSIRALPLKTVWMHLSHVSAAQAPLLPRGLSFEWQQLGTMAALLAYYRSEGWQLPMAIEKITEAAFASALPITISKETCGDLKTSVAGPLWTLDEDNENYDVLVADIRTAFNCWLLHHYYSCDVNDFKHFE